MSYVKKIEEIIDILKSEGVKGVPVMELVKRTGVSKPKVSWILAAFKCIEAIAFERRKGVVYVVWRLGITRGNVFEGASRVMVKGGIRRVVASGFEALIEADKALVEVEAK